MRALALVLLMLPLASAAAGVEIADAAGDQDMDVVWFTAPYSGTALDAHDDVCSNPRSDVTNVAASATNERIQILVSVVDLDALPTCAGTAVDLPPMEHFPFARLTLDRILEDGTTDTILNVYSIRRNDGWEQCVTYEEVATRVCTDEPAYVIDFPTTYATSSGATADLRGASYRLNGYSLDSYGRDDPKSNLMLFMDRLATSEGALVVPTG